MANYLLDSHILVWLRLEPKKIASIASLLADESNEVFYSVISPWELSIKETKGLLRLPQEFFSTLDTLGFECINVEEQHVLMLRSLPLLHHDPFDRMLAAQAAAEKMTLVTADKRLAAYPIKTLLVDL